MRLLLSLILSLFLSSSAFAQVDEWQRFSFFQNNGGLNDTFSPIVIGDNEASDIQNIVFTKAGHIQTRPGYIKINSSAVCMTCSAVGLNYYKQADGDEYLVGVFSDNSIRKMEYQPGGGPDGTWDDITGSLVFSNDVDTFASLTVGEDTVIIEDGIGTTAPYKWSGSGNATNLGGSPPNCKIVTYHKKHAFCAGNSSAQSTLYFSDLEDIENWTTGLSGNLFVETNDGTVIRDIEPGFDALYIWKDKSIWRLTGDDKDSFQLQRMIDGVGTQCSNCVDRVGNDFVFLSDQGKVYFYDGAVGLNLISPKIESELEDDTAFSRLKFASGVVLDSDFYISVSPVATSQNTKTLFFDSLHLAWSKFDGLDANVMAIASDGNDKDVIIFSDYDGFVYQYPSGEDDAGNSISTYYTTKWYSFPEFQSNFKDFKKVFVHANTQGSYNLSVDTFVDFEDTGTTFNIDLTPNASPAYGTSRFEGNNLVIEGIEPNKEGTYFKMKLYNTTQKIEIKGFEIYVDPSDRI